MLDQRNLRQKRLGTTADYSITNTLYFVGYLLRPPQFVPREVTYTTARETAIWTVCLEFLMVSKPTKTYFKLQPFYNFTAPKKYHYIYRQSTENIKTKYLHPKISSSLHYNTFNPFYVRTPQTSPGIPLITRVSIYKCPK